MTVLEKLAEKVKKGGREYRLVERTENKAIYEYIGVPVGYEVFIIKKVDPKKAAAYFGNRTGQPVDLESLPDLKETYPNNEDFGKTAWYYVDLESAKKRYEQLIV